MGDWIVFVAAAVAVLAIFFILYAYQSDVETDSEQQLKRKKSFRQSSKILGHEELFGEMKRASSTDSERVWGHAWVSKPYPDRIQPMGIKRYREEREEIDPVQVRRQALKLSLEQVRGSQGIYRPDFGRSRTRFLEGLKSDERFQTPTKTSRVEYQGNPSKSADLGYGNHTFLDVDLNQTAKFPERQEEVSFSRTAKSHSPIQPTTKAKEVGGMFKQMTAEPVKTAVRKGELTGFQPTLGIEDTDRKAWKQTTTGVPSSTQKNTSRTALEPISKKEKTGEPQTSYDTGPNKRKNPEMSLQSEQDIFPDLGKVLKSRTTVTMTKSKTTASMQFISSGDLS